MSVPGISWIVAWQQLFRFVFFFNDTATTEIYTLSLHDALPISPTTARITWISLIPISWLLARYTASWRTTDRKSTRLNSSHLVISYAVFCLKKKKRRTKYRQSCTIPEH